MLGASTGVVRDGTPVRVSTLPAAAPAGSAVLVPAGALPGAASAVR